VTAPTYTTRRVLSPAEVYASTPWFAAHDVASDADEVVCSDCGGSGQGWQGEHSRCRTCCGRGDVPSQVSL
jgi:hypothetical protein